MAYILIVIFVVVTVFLYFIEARPGIFAIVFIALGFLAYVAVPPLRVGIVKYWRRQFREVLIALGWIPSKNKL